MKWGVGAENEVEIEIQAIKTHTLKYKKIIKYWLFR